MLPNIIKKQIIFFCITFFIKSRFNQKGKLTFNKQIQKYQQSRRNPVILSKSTIINRMKKELIKQERKTIVKIASLIKKQALTLWYIKDLLYLCAAITS